MNAQPILVIVIFLVSMGCGGNNDVSQSNVEGVSSDCKLPKVLSSYLNSLDVCTSANDDESKTSAKLEIINRIRKETSFPLLTRKEAICYAGHSKELLPLKEDIEKVYSIISELHRKENNDLIKLFEKGKVMSEEFHDDGALKSKSVQVETSDDEKLEFSLSINEKGDTTYFSFFGDGFGDYHFDKNLLGEDGKVSYAKLGFEFEFNPDGREWKLFKIGNERIFFRTDNDVELYTLPECPHENIAIYKYDEGDEEIWFDNGKWIKLLHRNGDYSNKLTFDFKEEKFTQEFVSGETVKPECDYDLKFKLGDYDVLYLQMLKKNYSRSYNPDGTLYWEQDFENEKRNYYKDGNLVRTEKRSGYDTDDIYSRAWAVFFLQ